MPELTESRVWDAIARNYGAFTSPLVPCREDIDMYEHAIAAYSESPQPRGIDALMLGVTPALALMRWPPRTRITAVENSPAVIRALWPGDIPDVRKVKCANWFAALHGRKSCDIVVGDGSLAACRFPFEVRALSHSIRELLTDKGILVVRSYVRPPVPEAVEDVFRALLGGAAMSVDCFKLRLWLAMQQSATEGVAVREAAEILEDYRLDPKTMEERLGWTEAAIEPFTTWRTSNSIYTFPTLSELREVLSKVFDEVSISFPRYELGSCCPMLVMRPRPT